MISIMSSLRAAHRRISSRFVSGVVSAAPFDEELFEHIQPNNEIFSRPMPRALHAPDGFPFHVERGGESKSSLLRTYGQEEIIIEVDRNDSTSLQTSGLVFNERHQCLKFRMGLHQDAIRVDIITIGDAHSRHVDGSDKYLETKGIKPSAIGILYDFFKNRMIPRDHKFPFEIKNGPEKGTLTLRRKCEDEIIIVEVRAVDENRILDELADYEARDSLKRTEDIFNDDYRNDFEDYMKIFDEDKEVGNEEAVGDIGCLLLTVRVYYGVRFFKRIKLNAFAFPHQIFVPRITLTDHSTCDSEGLCRGTDGLKAFDTYFKDRGIHAGAMNFLKNSYPAYRTAFLYEPIVFGLFNEYQMEEAKVEAKKRYIEKCRKMVDKVIVNR